MIPADTTDPILKWLRDHVAQAGFAPSIHEIEAAANFRVRGGLTRLLSALREVAVLQTRQGRWNTQDAGALAKALMADLGFDDGEGKMIVCDENDMRVALKKAMGA